MPSTNELRSALSRWLSMKPVMITCVLVPVFFIAYSVIKRNGVLFPAQETGSPPAPTTARPASPDKTPPMSLDAISQQQVFAPVPETRLDLVLRGVAASEDKEQARAIIQNHIGEVRYFGIGERVFGIATLEAIDLDRVLLVRNGRYETLRLSGETAGDGQAPDLPESHGLVTSDATQELEQFVYDPARLDHYVGLVPVFVDPALGGIALVTASDEGSTFLGRLGLEPGDVVISVNGIRLNSESKIRQFRDILMSAQKMDFVVNRKGNVVSVSFRRSR